MDLKKIANNLSHVAHDIKEEIISIINSPEQQITRILSQKGITKINSQIWGTGFEIHNVVANSSGEVLTDNSAELTRILLNIALFADHGETRLNNAMSSSIITSLEKVKAPSQSVKSTKVSPFIINQNNE